MAIHIRPPNKRELKDGSLIGRYVRLNRQAHPSVRADMVSCIAIIKGVNFDETSKTYTLSIEVKPGQMPDDSLGLTGTIPPEGCFLV